MAKGFERKTRIWLGLGAAVLGGASTAIPVALGLELPRSTAPAPAFPGIQLAQEEEGGEGAVNGGAEGGVITVTDYRLRSTDPNVFQYDASRQAAAYAALAFETYSAAHADTLKMRAALAALLAAPSAQSLSDARAAWMAARASYARTEAFRYYNGPVDGAERRINAAPINPAYLDSVAGKPNAGLINDTAVPMSLETIVLRNQATGTDDVTTGWHAIEFLLWGEDRSATGPGMRPHTDYVAGQGNNDRRRAALTAMTDLLVNDIANVVAAWAPERENYRSSLASMDPRNVIGRAFHGIVVLAGFELGTRRIGRSLDSGDERDETSRFSDNTLADFTNDLRGLRNVYFGSSTGAAGGAGIDTLVAAADAALNTRVVAALTAAENAVAALDAPFDRILASPANSPARVKAEAAVMALQDLAESLRAAGNKLGLLVLMVPGEG